MSVNMKTKYLGMELANPVVVSACPLVAHADTLRRIEQAGAAAAVMPSLFEEQIERDESAFADLFESTTDRFPEANDFFPEMRRYNDGLESYLKYIEESRRKVSIPLIGSLNGCTPGGWVRHARRIEEAGAAALELNIYFVPTDPDETGEDVERRYVDLVAAVREVVSIPLAVKIGPYFSSTPNMARKLVQAGANGLVLFNRYLQPDLDIETLAITPRLNPSTRDELRTPLRWIAILRPHFDVSLAATSGVHAAEDVVKLILAGADIVTTASALYQHGVDHIRKLIEGTRGWLEEKGYCSVAQAKGSMSRVHAPDPAGFERANYIKAIVEFT